MNEWLDLKGHILLEIGIIAIATTLFAVMVRKIGDKLLKRLSRHDELDLTNYRFFQHIHHVDQQRTSGAWRSHG